MRIMKNILLVIVSFILLGGVGATGYYFGELTARNELTPSPTPINTNIPTPMASVAPETTPEEVPLTDEAAPLEGGESRIMPSTGSALPADDMVMCTMDAKMCPDGSFVGRQGPNCEFAPCPGE